MRKEYLEYRTQGEIREEGFRKLEWDKINSLIADPDRFFLEYIKEKFQISIIIAEPDDEYELQKSIETLFEQTLQGFEIVVAYNKEKKNIAETLRRYTNFDKRIVDVPIEENTVAAAKNAGIAAAHSDYVLFLSVENILSQTLLKNIAFSAMNYIPEDAENPKFTAPKNADICVFPIADYNGKGADNFENNRESVNNKLFSRLFINSYNLFFAEKEFSQNSEMMYCFNSFMKTKNVAIEKGFSNIRVYNSPISDFESFIKERFESYSELKKTNLQPKKQEKFDDYYDNFIVNDLRNIFYSDVYLNDTKKIIFGLFADNGFEKTAFSSVNIANLNDELKPFFKILTKISAYNADSYDVFYADTDGFSEVNSEEISTQNNSGKENFATSFPVVFKYIATKADNLGAPIIQISTGNENGNTASAELEFTLIDDFYALIKDRLILKVTYTEQSLKINALYWENGENAILPNIVYSTNMNKIVLYAKFFKSFSGFQCNLVSLTSNFGEPTFSFLADSEHLEKKYTLPENLKTINEVNPSKNKYL
jgi:hypothetical protein